MPAQTSLRALRSSLALLAAAGIAVADAGQMAAEVAVQVRLVTSSGACGVVDHPAQLGVTCAPPGGPLLPEPGAVPYHRVGSLPGAGVVSAPLPSNGDGVKVTSWRIVRLDNAEYLELTVAW